MAETQEQKIARLAAKQYRNWQEKRSVETGAAEYPKGWVWIDIPKFQDYYSVETIKKFITSAKRYNVDPYDFVALGIAESGLGRTTFSNPAHIDLPLHTRGLWWALHEKDPTKFRDPRQLPLEEKRDLYIDYSAKLLAEKLGKYKDKLSAIQAYSGTGKTVYGGDPETVKDLYGTTRLFGKPFSQINFWKEKPQAKRIAEISAQLKKQKSIDEYINELANLPE